MVRRRQASSAKQTFVKLNPRLDVTNSSLASHPQLHTISKPWTSGPKLCTRNPRPSARNKPLGLRPETLARASPSGLLRASGPTGLLETFGPPASAISASVRFLPNLRKSSAVRWWYPERCLKKHQIDLDRYYLSKEAAAPSYLPLGGVKLAHAALCAHERPGTCSSHRGAGGRDAAPSLPGGYQEGGFMGGCRSQWPGP